MSAASPAPLPQRNSKVARTYEIQFFRDGRWLIDSMFDERSLALFEAQRMAEGTRYTCVRVVEEVFYEASGRLVNTTIFRGGKHPEEIQKELRGAAEVRRQVIRETPKKQNLRKRGKYEETSAADEPLINIWTMLKAGAAVVIGIAFLYGLNYLQEITR